MTWGWGKGREEGEGTAGKGGEGRGREERGCHGVEQVWEEIDANG